MKQAIIQRLQDLEEYKPRYNTRHLLCNESTDRGRQQFKEDMTDLYPEDNLVFIYVSPLVPVRNWFENDGVYRQ